MEWDFPIQCRLKTGELMTYPKTDLHGTPENGHGKRPDIDADSKMVAAIASGVAKSILYICITIFCCFYISSCNLEATVIKQCEASCSTSGNRMKSVSNSTCECVARSEESGETTDDIWVLPQKQTVPSALPLQQSPW
jgi:hypothetical protein|tara:strand:+ start:3397 stop:3810 length:414 start_codon:yes stop_codon:yes gene_type:complete